MVREGGAERGRDRPGRSADRRQDAEDLVREAPVRGDLGGESFACPGVGQRAVDQEVPHVLEAPTLGEFRCRVLPVVVEALLAPDVAEAGLGDDHPLELCGRDVRFIGGMEVCEGGQISQRHDAQEASVDHHGQVPVVTLGELLPGGVDRRVGVEAVGVGRHPVRHRCGRQVGTGAGGAEHVSLGDDADGPPAVDHDERAHDVPVHVGSRDGDAVGRGGGLRRRRHDVADGAGVGRGSLRGTRGVHDPSVGASIDIVNVDQIKLSSTCAH